MHSRVAHCYAACPTVHAVTGYSCGYLCYACRVEFPVFTNKAHENTPDTFVCRLANRTFRETPLEFQWTALHFQPAEKIKCTVIFTSSMNIFRITL